MIAHLLSAYWGPGPARNAFTYYPIESSLEPKGVGIIITPFSQIRKLKRFYHDSTMEPTQ